MKSIVLASLVFFGLNAAARHDLDHSMMEQLVYTDGDHLAQVTWEAGPQVGVKSTLRIEWKNAADHVAVEPPGTFKVVLWMPSMGHGSAPTQVQRVFSEEGTPLTGAYRVTNAQFIMGGDWDVNVTLTSENGRTETKTLKVKLPF